MIKTFLLLTALALVQSRPSDEADLTNLRLREPHEDCPPAEIHFLLPHEYDCTKFYYCEYGLKWIEPRSCAPGTEFNAQIQVCVHPISSGCTLPGPGSTPADATTEATATPTVAPSTLLPTTSPAITEPTIPEVTTSEATTPEVASPEPTTPEVASPEPTTPEVASPEPTTPEVASPEPTTPEVASPEPTTPEVASPEPTTPEVATEPPQPDVTTSEPTQPDPTIPEATTAGTEPPSDTEGPSAAPSTSAPVSTANPEDCETLDNGCPADFDIHKLLPHEEFCHQFYYCDKGQLVLRYCAPGTYFNPKLEVCDWPENVDCVNDGSYEYPTTSAPATSSPSPPGDGDIGDVLDNGCPADFDVHHLLPHETECNKFYYCVFGQKVERSCAPGTYFNYEIQACDWPFNVNCSSSGTTPGGAPDTTPSGTTDDTSGSEEIPNPSDPVEPEAPIEWEPLPNGCPADFDVHHLLPHESDCDKFYYCVDGQTFETECPPGTHFSPSQQVCDWPQYAGCEHWNGGCSGPGDENGGCAGTTAPGGNDGTTAAPGGNDGTTAAPGGNDGTTAAPGGNDGTTAAPGGNDGTTAAPGDNNSTTAAPGGNDGTTAAPGGNDGTTAAPGDNNGTTAAPGGNDGTTAAPGGNDGTTAAPGDNNSTTAAPGGNDGTTAAPGGNDGTTAAPGGNDGTTAAPGGNDGTTAAPGGNDGTTAAPGDNDGTTAAPGGNDGTTAAPGGNDGTTAAPGGNDGTTAAPGGNDGTTAAPGGNDGTTAAPGCTTCPPVTPADRCKSGCNVLPFVHDNDCDKYWICNGDQPILVTCSEGLHFNPSTYTCDFICNAGCVRENVQITSLTEGVKLFLPWGSITSEMRNLLNEELNADL